MQKRTCELLEPGGGPPGTIISTVPRPIACPPPGREARYSRIHVAGLLSGLARTFADAARRDYHKDIAFSRKPLLAGRKLARNRNHCRWRKRLPHAARLSAGTVAIVVKRQVNSVAKSAASAALPPLPQTSSFPPARGSANHIRTRSILFERPN